MSDLQALLGRMGVVRMNGTNYCCCPKCQPDEDDPDAFKLVVGKGTKYPLLLHCLRCCISKPQDEAGRRHNRTVVRDICQKLGIADVAYTQMDRSEIDRLWSEVRIGGQEVLDGEERASDHNLHIAHQSLIASLELNERHRKWLTKKGLDPERCYEVGYRSADGPIQSKLVMDGVPGLVDGLWRLRRSLLMPCYDRSGLVLSFKMRLSGEGKGRLRMLSGGGVTAKRVVHWPVGVTVVRGEPIWIVESERAADCLHQRWGVNVVALSGVGFWSRAIPIVQEAGGAILALDQDDAGRTHTRLLRKALWDMGVKSEVAVWDGAKGPDDALVAERPIRLETWQTGKCIPTENNNNLTPNQKSPSTSGRRLRDSEVLPFIREHQPVLRSEINCYQPYISELLRQGRLTMWKNEFGQVLGVPNESTVNEH